MHRLQITLAVVVKFTIWAWISYKLSLDTIVFTEVISVQLTVFFVLSQDRKRSTVPLKWDTATPSRASRSYTEEEVIQELYRV